MSEFRYDTLDHLLVRVGVDLPWLKVRYWGHAHEDEALECARLERMGWPALPLEHADDMEERL